MWLVHLEVYVDELVGEGGELVAEAGDVLPWSGVRGQGAGGQVGR